MRFEIALFLIVKTWKWLKYLSIEKYLNYVLATLEFCATEINDEVELYVLIWKVMHENLLLLLKNK